jgi:hypothetical protein
MSAATLMGPPGSYELMCRDLVRYFWEQAHICRIEGTVPLAPQLTVRMVGLLFARPEIPFVASEIVPSLPYYHLRSGKHINFYCSGFLPDWNPSLNPDRYSNRAFEQFRFEIEGRSTWRYSGGADLLLTNARFDGQIAWLDFSSAISADLIKMKADGAIHSVDSFFEAIFRYAQNQDGSDPTWGFSDQQGKRVAGSAFKSLLISLLPKGLQDDARRAFHFAVSDVSCEPANSS